MSDGIYFDISKAANPVPTTAAPTGSNAMGKDEFLKLMMAQLQAQDPTAPSDSNAFVAQLAQFTSLEQMQNMNSSLGSLLVGQASGNNTDAVSLVGKDITYNTDQITLGTGGTPPTAKATLSAAASSITATITDSNGKVIRTLNLGGHDAGDVSIGWDGRDQSNNTAPPGTYTVSVVAKDAQGNAVPTTQTAVGRVTGVSFANGYAQPIVGDEHLKMADIIEINERTTP
jgi:flagellar basal-body rod modification protein FlgD